MTKFHCYELSINVIIPYLFDNSNISPQNSSLRSIVLSNLIKSHLANKYVQNHGLTRLTEPG